MCLFLLEVLSSSSLVHVLDFYMVNKSLPWDYEFRFVIEEISNINDKAQVRDVVWYDFDVMYII